MSFRYVWGWPTYRVKLMLWLFNNFLDVAEKWTVFKEIAKIKNRDLEKWAKENKENLEHSKRELKKWQKN